MRPDLIARLWEVQAEEAAAVLVFLDLATGKLDEKELARWLEGESRVSPRDR